MSNLVPKDNKVSVSVSFLKDFPSGLQGNSHQRIESGILTTKPINICG